MNNPNKNVKYFVVAAFLIAAIVSVLMIGKVKINYNISEYLNEETETKIALGIIEEEFGLSGDAQVMIENVDVAEALKIKEIISGVDGVVAVSFDESSTDFYKNNNALFTVLLDGDEYSESARGAVAAIEDMLDDTYGERLHMGGTVAEKIALRNAIQTEIALILAISLCLVAVLMLITAKSWLEPIVILLAAGVAVLLNMGTNIFFGQISYITNAVAAILQLALSMDYSIMLLHGYREMKKDNDDIHVAMNKAIKNVVRPVSASALTTIAGLLALLFMSFRIGFDIGIVLMKSIVCSAFTALTLLPAFLLIFDKLLAKTEKRELVLKGKAFADLAFKGAKIVTPIALVIVVACCVLQTGNSYSFTDASNKNEAIIDTFGENGTVIIVYENSDEAETAERKLASVLASYKKEDGSPVIKKITSLASTVRAEYDVKAAASTLGIDEERAELLFAVYHLTLNNDSIKMSSKTFVDLANGLLATDLDAAKLATEEVKAALGSVVTVGQIMNDHHTKDSFYSVIAESKLVDEAKLTTLGAMIDQMYGLKLYDKIENNKVSMAEMLAFIKTAVQNPLASEFIPDNAIDSVELLLSEIENLKLQKEELNGYIATLEELKGYLATYEEITEYLAKYEEITGYLATYEELTGYLATYEELTGLVATYQEITGYLATYREITGYLATYKELTGYLATYQELTGYIAKYQEITGYLATYQELTGYLATYQELTGYITTYQEITALKPVLTAQKAELIALKQEVTTQLEKLNDTLRLQTILNNTEQIATLKQKIAEAEAGIDQINAGLAQIDEGLEQIDAGIAQIEPRLDEINDGIAQIEPMLPEIEAGIAQIEPRLDEIYDGIAQIEPMLPEIYAGIAQIEPRLPEINAGIAQIAPRLPEINAGIAQIGPMLPEINDGIAQIEPRLDEIYDGIAQIEPMLPEIYDGIAQIEPRLDEIYDGIAQIEPRLDEIYDGIAQIEPRLDEINDGIAQIEPMLPEIEAGIAQIDAALAVVDAAYSYEEFIPAIQSLVAAKEENSDTLNGLDGISSETIRQLYILYFNDKGIIPNEAILGSEFVEFILSSSPIALPEETEAMLLKLVETNKFLTDTAEYTFTEMTEKLTDLAKTVLPEGSNSDITPALLMGMYAKQAVATKLFSTSTVSAEKIVEFLSGDELPLVTLTDDQKAAIDDAKAALESGKALLVGENYTRLLLSVDLPAESADSSKFAKSLTADVKSIFGDNAHVAGEIISTNDLNEAFDFDNKLISIFTIVSIFLIIMLVFKSISLPVILVAVIQGAIWIAMSTSLITGPMFFMSYIMAICILMGATIDYGILMSTSYVNARSTMNKKDALIRALELAMPTVFTSGLILMICGFVVGLIASQTSISSVGFLLFKGTLISTVMITVVLPSILYLLDSIVLKLTIKKKEK